MRGAPFTVEELAFFQVPRSWSEITARFGKHKRARALDAVLEADSDGGRGLLGWSCRLRKWRLTEAGRDYTRKVLAA